MFATKTDCFRDGIERCLRKAATAPNREIETLWLSVADSYQYLLEREQHEKARGTWEWNVRL